MRARSGLLAALALFAAGLLLAALLGRRQRGVVNDDERPSSYVSGPGGVSALYEALPALGVQVSRLRERPHDAYTAAPRSVLLILSPERPVSSEEASALLTLADTSMAGGDLVLAGEGTFGIAECLGVWIRPFVLDSSRVFLDAGEWPGAPVFAHAILKAASPGRAESTGPLRLQRLRCPDARVVGADTLLASNSGPVAIRLTRAGGREVIVVADVGLFRNRQLRGTQAGPFILGLLKRRYDAVVFDEYHHGFGPSGSLGGALLGWSVRSPLGWGIWQAGIASFLGLLAAALRFGPPRALLARRRRASLEHVRALATALAAARGHDVAISVLVQGLRRRLASKGVGSRVATGETGAPGGMKRAREREWLDTLDRRVLAPGARESLTALRQFTNPGQNAEAVLRAANAVEDVWDTLRHPATAT